VCYNFEHMKYPILILLLAVALISGCATQVPIEITRFNPQITGKNQSIFQYMDETYVSAEADDLTIETALFEYNSIVVLPISLTNKTIDNLEPDNYSIELFDGRDRKPAKLLKRDDLVKIRAKYTGGSPGAIQDQVIEATMTNVMNVVNVPTKDKLIKMMDYVIGNYFEFRPVYKGETRKGLLCFLRNFKFEYPLTLIVKHNGEVTTLKFVAAKKS